MKKFNLIDKIYTKFSNDLDRAINIESIYRCYSEFETSINPFLI